MLDDEKFLETLIHAGRTGPDASQVDRLEQRLEPTFLSAQPTSSSAPRVHGVKWMLAVLGIGLLSSVTDTRGPATGDEPQSVAVKAEAEPGPVAMTVTVSEEPPASIAELETVPAAAPTTEPVRAAVSSHVVAAPSIPARTPTKAPVPTTPPAAPSEGTSEAPSEAVAAAESSTPSNVDDAIASPSPEELPSARAPSGESEVAYLRRAQAALSANPTRALALADDHPSRFPDGVLAQEREVIAIDALVKLRRTTEARARVAAFRVRYPSSAHLARVLSAVGDVP
ncbi:MAG: hypothetical protein BGO98_37340 [Myxococcales bacterium 68-20]|nr:hypothetical protein [Myxococcales bacterium]OJY22256.1 MAG: hypothetical protein BGO98_37340 [Myxococcales bacterium 68-20]